MKYILLFLLLIPAIAHAQSDQAAINDLSASGTDYTQQTTTIASCVTTTNAAQAQQVVDTQKMAQDQAVISAYNASVAQTASGVNWDYFVTLEPQIPFATWSKVDNGINWTAITSTLGITCGGITESAVNWSNWGACEANGMTPGTPFGGKATGIAAFWCGNGKITGTC